MRSFFKFMIIGWVGVVVSVVLLIVVLSIYQSFQKMSWVRTHAVIDRVTIVDYDYTTKESCPSVRSGANRIGRRGWVKACLRRDTIYFLKYKTLEHGKEITVTHTQRRQDGQTEDKCIGLVGYEVIIKYNPDKPERMTIIGFDRECPKYGQKRVAQRREKRE